MSPLTPGGKSGASFRDDHSILPEIRRQINSLPAISQSQADRLAELLAGVR